MLSLIVAILCFSAGYPVLGVWASIWCVICVGILCFKLGKESS